MTAQERLAVLSSLGQDRLSIALPLSEVQELNAYLREEWMIFQPHNTVKEWKDWLWEATNHAKIASRYLDMAAERYDREEQGRTSSPWLDQQFYDVMADDALAGVTHSPRRTYILDSAALATVLMRIAKIEGVILDLGSHIGYHTIWLGRKHTNRVVGIDYSKKAIEYAQARAKEMTNVEFRHLDFTATDMTERFEMILCVDAIPEDDRRRRLAIGWIGQHLVDGGVALLVDRCRTWNCDSLRAWLKSASLGFALSDQVGGWLGAGDDFAGQDALVLVKGIVAPLPKPSLVWVLEWPEFADYANTKGVPVEEMTQAYFRAKLKEGLLAKPHTEP